MRRLILVLVLLPDLAFAEDVVLSCDAVMFIRDTHAQPVLDDPTHVVATGTFRGIATFHDGEDVLHRYEGFFDLVNGEGRFHGSALRQFEDGSELRREYDGIALAATDEGVDCHAGFSSVTGTDRFEGATGTGTFEGRRFEPLEVGGVAKLYGKLELTLPQGLSPSSVWRFRWQHRSAHRRSRRA